MTDKYESLRAALNAAPTPGLWHAPGLGEVHDETCRCIAVCVDCEPVEEKKRPVPDIDEGDRIARYITAAQPTVIRDLLAERDRLRDALELFLAHSPEPECAVWRHVHAVARDALAQEQGESNAAGD